MEAQVTDEAAETNTLAKLDGAMLALAEARTLPNVKTIINMAETAKTYARAAKLGQEKQNAAAEIAIEAKVKAGDMFDQLPKSPGGRPARTADRSSRVSEYRRALIETETEEWEAVRWQRLARVDPALRAMYYANTRRVVGEITEAGLLRTVTKYEQAATPTVWEEAVENEILPRDEALRKAFESALRRVLKGYCSRGGDEQAAAEVLRRDFGVVAALIAADDLGAELEVEPLVGEGTA